MYKFQLHESMSRQQQHQLQQLMEQQHFTLVDTFSHCGLFNWKHIIVCCFYMANNRRQR